MDTNENLSWRERTEELIAEAEKTNDPRSASGESRVNGMKLSRFLELYEQCDTEEQKYLHEKLWLGFELAMRELGPKPFTPALHHRPEVQEFFRRFAYLAYTDLGSWHFLDAREVYLFFWLCEDVQEIAHGFDRIRKEK